MSEPPLHRRNVDVRVDPCDAGHVVAVRPRRHCTNPRALPRPRVIGHPPTPSTACLGTGPLVCVKMNCRILIGAKSRELKSLGDPLHSGHELVLRHFIDEVDLVHPLAPIEVALVDGVDSQEPGTTLRVGLASLANVDLGGLGLRRGIATAPVRRRLANPVEVAVRQPRQALEPLIAKDLVLTAHHPPRGRSTQPAQRLVDLGEQPDVNRGVPPLKRARRTAAPVPNVSRVLVLTNQPRALRPRQPRDLRHKATHDPFVRLAQPRVVQPSQGPRHEVVRPPPLGEVKVNRFAAGHEIANLVYGAHPFDVQFQEHPPMIPKPPRSGSPLVGFAPTLQAHVSWDKTRS